MAAAFLLALLSIHAASAISHTVVSGDTLFGLSLKYNISMDLIRRTNSINGNNLRTGQTLNIPTEGDIEILIRPGDTLSGLSLAFDVDMEELRRINNLTGDNLRIGAALTIPAPAPEGTYRVRPGDTLSEIALKLDIPESRLMAYNNLEDHLIRPGQELITSPARPEGHLVAQGESLWSLAGRYNLDIEDLRRWNNIENNVIHPGQILALFPGIVPDTAVDILPADTPDVALAGITAAPPQAAPDGPPVVEDYYYFSAPRVERQPSTVYWEEPDASTATDDRRARRILDTLDAEIAAMPPLSRSLEGWLVVIDPGHGGLDPGAIVAVTDGNGNPTVVTEDEYAYDISLRLYRLLKRHGASVELTILAPDHSIRDDTDARQTFVHRKNEVYNRSSHNAADGWRPVGTAEGLDFRKSIASDHIAAARSWEKSRGTLFISIHCDNSSELPPGAAVLFDGAGDSELGSSRMLAETMAPQLGQGAFTRQQQLRVLRNNPADAAVLVEARNVYYNRNAWALRSLDIREQDAQKIANGVLAWARR